MLAWLGKETKPIPHEAEQCCVYCDSYPDTWDPKREASMRKKTAEKMKGKKGTKQPERYAGIYYDAQTGSWFCLTERMRRCPIEGRLFYHPHLQRVVNCVRVGLFTELDGRPIEESI